MPKEKAKTATAEVKESKPKKVAAPKEAKKVDEKTITILSALYGIDKNRIEVKDAVKVGRKITNKMFGGKDPAPKVKKELYIKATINGAQVEKTFAEGEKVKF